LTTTLTLLNAMAALATTKLSGRSWRQGSRHHVTALIAVSTLSRWKSQRCRPKFHDL